MFFQDQQIIKMNDKIKEDAIKMNLYSYALQQSNDQNSIQMMQTFHKSNFLPTKSNSFKQVSDWTNRYDNSEQQLKINTKSCQKIPKIIQQETDAKRSTYLYVKKINNNKSNGEQTQQMPIFPKKKVELNPITMRFDLSKDKHTKKKKTFSLGKKQQNISIYQLNYGPLNLLYELKTKQKNSKSPKLALNNNQNEQLPNLYSHSNTMKYPKTERVSSILRALKRNHQMRVYKHSLSINDEQKWQIFKQ